MLFSSRRKNRARRRDEQQEFAYKAYAPIDEEVRRESFTENATQTILRHEVVNYCEQMIDLSREIEDTRTEYLSVSGFLSDIAVLEELSAEDKRPILETANHILSLNKSREEFLSADKKLTDTQFALMDENDAQMPRLIKRLEQNETYLSAIKKDMHYLEGEKLEWDIVRRESVHEQMVLRIFAIVLLCLLATAVGAILITAHVLKADLNLVLLVVLFVAALLATYILFKYQDLSKEIRQSDANRNRAISLENHVKIRYVSMKNAVDYTCQKFQVVNAKQLLYIYEKYQEAVREQKRFERMNDDLHYYENQLAVELKSRWLKDGSGWGNYARALVDKKEMAVLKNELLARQKKLHYRLQYNLDAIKEMMHNVERNLDDMGDSRAQIEEILKKIAMITERGI